MGNVRQASVGTPSTSTVQAPHSPSSQPCLVPVSSNCSRSTSSSVRWTGTAIVWDSPLTAKVICSYIIRLLIGKAVGIRDYRCQSLIPNPPIGLDRRGLQQRLHHHAILLGLFA